MRKRTVNLAHNERLEDFGVRSTQSAQERKAEYARQCRELQPEQQAPYWLAVMKNDPQVASLVRFKVTKHDV